MAPGPRKPVESLQSVGESSGLNLEPVFGESLAVPWKERTCPSSGPGPGDEGLYTLTVTKSPSGDFDFYSVVAVAGDLIEVEIDTDPYGGLLDSVIVVYDSAGFPVALNDDDAGAGPGEVPWDSYVAFTAPNRDTF